MELRVDTEPVDGSVAVRVRVRLTQREIGRVFTSGDLLLHLPSEGLVSEEADRPVPRTSMYLSELAELREGYRRVFCDQSAADAFAAELREQLQHAAGIVGAP